LTAAHCIKTKFLIQTTVLRCLYYSYGYCIYYYYDYAYAYAYVNDPFDSSQYTVYLGVHNQYELTQSVVQMPVKKIIRVIKIITEKFKIYKNLKHN
jgi:hypothetical protein